MGNNITSNDTNIVNTIETIKTARKLLGITQHELADKTGLSHSLISKAESGSKQLSAESTNKIFTALQNEGFNLVALMQLTQLIKSKEGK